MKLAELWSNVWGLELPVKAIPAGNSLLLRFTEHPEAEFLVKSLKDRNETLHLEFQQRSDCLPVVFESASFEVVTFIVACANELVMAEGGPFRHELTFEFEDVVILNPFAGMDWDGTYDEADGEKVLRTRGDPVERFGSAYGQFVCNLKNKIQQSLQLGNEDARKSIPVGSQICSVLGECDCGVMSWDVHEVEVERSTGPNAIGVVISHDRHSNGAHSYGVVFPDNNEVWVNLDETDFVDPGRYRLIVPGTGLRPNIPTSAFRDPSIVKQIEIEIQNTPRPSVGR